MGDHGKGIYLVPGSFVRFAVEIDGPLKFPYVPACLFLGFQGQSPKGQEDDI
jgi:hypothetical protein